MFNNGTIRLRKVEPVDLPFLYAVENDDSQWLESAVHNPLSQKDLRDYIELSTGDIFKDGQLRLIVERREKRQRTKDEWQTVGVCDLFDFDPLARKAAIGLYVVPSARGQHIAHQTMLLLEEYAFSFLRLQQLYAIISIDNISCIRLFESLLYHASARLLKWNGKQDAIVFQRFISPQEK